MTSAAAGEVRGQIRQLCHRGLDWAALREQAGELIRRVIPHERACWYPTDPATLLVTGSYVENLCGDGSPPLSWCEYAVEDVNKWSFVARSPWPVGILCRATHGHRDQSPRYRELLRPQGIGWELRASFVADSACWGTVGLYRDRGEPDFNDEETAFVAGIAPTPGEDFRRALLIVDDVMLPAAAKKAIRAHAISRKKAEQEDRRAALAARRALRVLRGGRPKMSARVAARVLGLSHQRVHQLAQHERTRG